MRIIMEQNSGEKCLKCGRRFVHRWWEPLWTACSCFKSMKTSEFEELFHLDDDDYLLLSDTSEKRSVKIKLSTLKLFLKQ